MSPLMGISQAGQSLQSVWDRVGNKTDELAAQLSSGDVDAGSFVKTVVELKALKLQADAASDPTPTTTEEPT